VWWYTGRVRASGAVLPELGFDFAEAAKEPLAIDEGIDEHPLGRSGGVETLVIFRGKGFEIALKLSADDMGFGVDAGFERIHGRVGFALGSARSGGFTSVEAIGLDLLLGWHGVESKRGVKRGQWRGSANG